MNNFFSPQPKTEALRLEHVKALVRSSLELSEDDVVFVQETHCPDVVCRNCRSDRQNPATTMIANTSSEGSGTGAEAMPK